MNHRLPLVLAAVITALNALKPAVVDDTAYLLFARHIASDPLHPYGFDLFWYYRPEPAMTILLPPVLPYWLAGGIALFGENLVLLKMWLFPFAWVLCAAVRSLLRRFAAAVERPGTIAFCLSPAVLPLFSFMLDVPALALGAAAVALFVKGCDGRKVWAVLLAGVCTALAVQTKYTMLAVPPVLVAYAFTRLGKPHSVRSLVYLLVTLTLSVGLFAGWERWLIEQHGESHFLHHLQDNADDGTPLRQKLEERFGYAPLLLGQFGGLACGVSFVASVGIGWPRGVRVAVAVFITGVLGAICLLPYSQTIPFGRRLDLPYLYFMTLGGSVIVNVLYGVGRAVWKKLADADTLFLVGWLVVEAVGMLGMTPFPAARRVIGVCLAAAVLLMHLAAKVGGNVRVPRWVVAFAVGLGVLVWAIDCWDAIPEKAMAGRAAAEVQPGPGETVWYVGHWGFQYYCERAGMKHLDPYRGGTPMRAGDWLVLPLLPDDGGFYRPCPMTPDEMPRWDMRLVPVGEWEWRDGLSAQTVPNLYGGSGATVKGRDHPRLKVGVFRVTRDWVP
jgi:hypothetical protein